MVADRLSAVRARVEAAAARSGRDPNDIVLVAVSKSVGPDEIMEAYDSGHRDFGENRSHELLAKADVLPADIVWHFVGTLQSRKAREVGPVAATIHSIDRQSLLAALAKATSDAQLFLQVNVAAEPQKHGVAPSAADDLLVAAAQVNLSLTGLMVIPPVGHDPESSRRWFRDLRLLRDRLAVNWPELTELSMGMTDDFEVAIEEGATLIRVGRAIFEPKG